MELYDFYFKRLHHFAVNFVFDYDVANDIVQSVFIKLYESISGFSADVNIGAYLCVMVRNRCLNYLRDQNIEDRHKILYLQAAEETETLSWIDDEELIRKIHAVIEKLPEKCREICELRFYKNMKFSEIAAQLAVSENTAKVQVHRAIQKIKETLSTEDVMLIGLLSFFAIFKSAKKNKIFQKNCFFSCKPFVKTCVIKMRSRKMEERSEKTSLIERKWIGGLSIKVYKER